MKIRVYVLALLLGSALGLTARALDVDGSVGVIGQTAPAHVEAVSLHGDALGVVRRNDGGITLIVPHQDNAVVMVEDVFGNVLEVQHVLGHTATILSNLPEAPVDWTLGFRVTVEDASGSALVASGELSASDDDWGIPVGDGASGPSSTGGGGAEGNLGGYTFQCSKVPKCRLTLIFTPPIDTITIVLEKDESAYVPNSPNLLAATCTCA